jgi:class 3 adenylate cyclase
MRKLLRRRRIRRNLKGVRSKNKLEQIAELFEAKDIDFDVLPKLSEADLEKLGLSVGNRIRLLKALAERDGQAAKSKSPGSDAWAEAERRQVTVLFCDMVGSTALSGALDPELLGDLLKRHQNPAARAVARFGGFVAKFIGDRILAYFGFPRALEDSAEPAYAPPSVSWPMSAGSCARTASRSRRGSASPPALS